MLQQISNKIEKKVRRRIYQQINRYGSWHYGKDFYLSYGVQQALTIPTSVLTTPLHNEKMLGDLVVNKKLDFTLEEMFWLKGAPLPCYEERHLTLFDRWLSAENNYPLYADLFDQLTKDRDKTRFLEIGVWTGYVGVLFARFAHGERFYLGVDPNEYQKDGLQLASKTFKLLRGEVEMFDFALLEGYSWQRSIQNSLLLSGSFDLIHIDGEHTLTTKLIDLELARQLVEGCA